MEKKNYKRIDWSKRKPIGQCLSSGDTNRSHFDLTINIDENTPITSDNLEENIVVN